jgi:pilus assembly protein CpaE
VAADTERSKEEAVVMSTAMRGPDSVSMNALSIVLISPNDSRRRTLANALSGPQATISREFGEYPHFETISQVLEADCDVMIVDVDDDAERALALVENICANFPTVTVMIYSSRNDSELLVRCMRAGARELLTEPVRPSAITDALIRASARLMEVRRTKKVTGKALVFVGSKGGSGVTTIASNFALLLAKESGTKVALVDMDLYLGDAALNLGIKPQFTILDALQNEQRLDSHFLETLLFKHDSGLMVLAAPDVYASFPSSDEGAGKVLRLLQSTFDYVVVDAGDAIGHSGDALLSEADTIYLVTQVNIPALRNSHRLIPHLVGEGQNRKLEVVLNRFDSRLTDIDEAGIAKALGQPPKWKVPNDYVAVRRAQNTGTPLAMEDTVISRTLGEMARAMCGKSTAPAKKKRFGLFG